MKKFLAFFGLVFLISCGPSEDSPWPFYELVYGTTVSAHNAEMNLEKTLQEYVKMNDGDSTLSNAGWYQMLKDSNFAIIARIEESMSVLRNAPDGDEYKEEKEMALDMLKYQQVYHANSVAFVIASGEDGILDQKERLMLGAWKDSYQTLQNYYGEWKTYRDDYISGLKLPDDELQALSAKYGKD